MLLNLFKHFSKFHSRSSVIFIWKSLILRFWWKPYTFLPTQKRFKLPPSLLDFGIKISLEFCKRATNQYYRRVSR